MENYLLEIDRRFSRSDQKWDGETISNFTTVLTYIKSMMRDYDLGTECIVDLAFEKSDYKRTPVALYTLMVMQELETILMALPICYAVLFGKDGQQDWARSYLANIMRDVKPVLSQLSEYIPNKWERDAQTREEVVLNQTLDEWLEKDIDWKEEHGEPTATILRRVADIGMEKSKRFVVLLPPLEYFPFLWARHDMSQQAGVKMISVEHQIASAKIIRIAEHKISTSFDHAVSQCVAATSDWLKNNYNHPEAWPELKTCDFEAISFIEAFVTTGPFDCSFWGQWASETWDTSDQLIGQMHKFYFPPVGFYWPSCWRLFFTPTSPS